MELIEVLGWGLLAGLIGTVVLTISENIEIKLTGRAPSMVPGEVGFRLFGKRPKNQEDLKKVSSFVHWTHGITLGALFGLLTLLDLNLALTVALFFGLLWPGDVMLYKALKIAEWPWKWRRSELLTDLFHKGVYAVATGLAFVAIT